MKYISIGVDSEEKGLVDNVFVVGARPLYCLVVYTAIENLQTNITGTVQFGNSILSLNKNENLFVFVFQIIEFFYIGVSFARTGWEVIVISIKNCLKYTFGSHTIG